MRKDIKHVQGVIAEIRQEYNRTKNNRLLADDMRKRKLDGLAAQLRHLRKCLPKGENA